MKTAMNVNAFKISLLSIIDSFLNESLAASDFVNMYEDMFANNMPGDIDDDLYKGMDDLINWTALYTENPLHRAEERALIDEQELRSKVQIFLDTHGDALRKAGGSA